MKIMRKKYLIWIGAVLLAVLLLVTGGVFAKYVRQHTADKAVSSKTFYFESDYLTTDNHVYKLNAGTDSVTIELYNFENELRVSEVDCTYTVTVETDDESIKIGETLTKTAIYTAPASSATPNLITLSDLDNGYSYKVCVTAKGGYEKTLSATFVIAESPDGFYMNVDDTDPNYVILTVWTKNMNGTVTITFPDGLIPDATDPLMANIHNYTNGSYTRATFTDIDTFKQNGYSSRMYRFFKTKDYNGGNFEIKLNNNVPATETTLG